MTTLTTTLYNQRRTSGMLKYLYIIKYIYKVKYFSHEDRQKFLKALRNRQDLFQEEGILNLILDMIDKMNVITSQVIYVPFKCF